MLPIYSFLLHTLKGQQRSTDCFQPKSDIRERQYLDRYAFRKGPLNRPEEVVQSRVLAFYTNFLSGRLKA